MTKANKFKEEYTKDDDFDTGVYNSFDEPVKQNSFVMCCYFNIGIEAEIGMCVERNR